MINLIAALRRTTIVAATNSGREIDMMDMGAELTPLCVALKEANGGIMPVPLSAEEKAAAAETSDGIDESGHEYDHRGWTADY